MTERVRLSPMTIREIAEAYLETGSPKRVASMMGPGWSVTAINWVLQRIKNETGGRSRVDGCNLLLYARHF